MFEGGQDRKPAPPRIKHVDSIDTRSYNKVCDLTSKFCHKSQMSTIFALYFRGKDATGVASGSLRHGSQLRCMKNYFTRAVIIHSSLQAKLLLFKAPCMHTRLMGK